MKLFRLLAVVLLATASAFAWPSCSGQWVSVPAGTSSANGVIYSTGDLTFQCQKTPDPTKPTSTIATSTATSNSNSNASANSGSTSSATGGNATANGGSSTSKSGVVNSGNSSNTNNNTANGGAGGNASQTQSQSNTSTNSNQSTAANNGNNSNNSVTNIAASKIPVASAYAPGSLPSAPCVKGFGAGLQTVPIGGSFGGSKTDVGCDDRETARAYALLGSRLAACKTLVYGSKNQKLAKKHPEQAITLDDCMQQEEQTVVVAPPAPPVAPVQPISVTVNNPPAQVAVLPVLHEEITVTATRAQVRAAQQSVKPVVKKRTAPKPCIVPDSLKQPMEK